VVIRSSRKVVALRGCSGHADSSDKAQLRVIVIVDDPGARGAIPAGLEGASARRVTGEFAGTGTSRPPLRKQSECAGQFTAGSREGVLEAGWPLRIWPSDDKRLLFEVLETLGQDVRRDPRQVGAELVEAAGPLKERLDYQEGPPIAHAAEGVRQR
jgi:hypothetical protein